MIFSEQGKNWHDHNVARKKIKDLEKLIQRWFKMLLWFGTVLQ